MDLQHAHKTALVTGSTGGIGYAIAKNLLKEGSAVNINGRTQERVDNALQQLRQEIQNADVKGRAADFSNVNEINALITKIPAPDILISNLGIYEPNNFVDITDEDWSRFFEVNVMSGVRLIRHYFPAMLKKNWGRIIFISGASALNIPSEMIQYGAIKTMQLAISRGLAELTKGTGVTVNAVLPGPIRVEGTKNYIHNLSTQQNKSEAEVEKEFFQFERPTSLIQRFATTEEVANLVTYIASQPSSATNGAALRVDGGVVKTAI